MQEYYVDCPKCCWEGMTSECKHPDELTDLCPKCGHKVDFTDLSGDCGEQEGVEGALT